MTYLEDTPSDIIKKAREGRKVSLRTLADELSVSPKELQQEEEGIKPATPQFVTALGLSYERLVKIAAQNYMVEPSPETIGEIKLKVFQVEVGGIFSNAYILTQGHYAVLVDSIGASTDAVAYLKEQGVHPNYLLITHGHFDHIAGIEVLTEIYSDIRVIHAAKDIHGDRMDFECAGFKIEVIRTPGHTEDAVCYLINGVIAFVGDIIFAGSVGRPNYSYEKLLENIKTQIFEWPDKVILCPGHGPLTTVGEEKRSNPFF